MYKTVALYARVSTLNGQNPEDAALRTARLLPAERIRDRERIC